MSIQKWLPVILLCVIAMSCKKEHETVFRIDGLTTDNYPKVDGSTSTEPLHLLLACKLLGARYEWTQRVFLDNTWALQPNYDDIPREFFTERIKTSQTHQSIINLIDKKADIILSARKMSDDEKAHADDAGVTLIETPVALDAFVFITNPKNPVASLTMSQVQDIYTGDITNWKDVGGEHRDITPYVRNQNSGSQELMESLVMEGLTMPTWNVEVLSSMMLAFTNIRSDESGICYTVHYYKDQIVRDNKEVKTLAIDGIKPETKTIQNKTYPLVAEVYAVIRKDLDPSSMAYKLYQLLQSEDGKKLIRQSGYIPN